MKPPLASATADTAQEETLAAPAASEIMLLPDGRILAHHLTPELASLLNTMTGLAPDRKTEPER